MERTAQKYATVLMEESVDVFTGDVNVILGIRGVCVKTNVTRVTMVTTVH